MSALIKALLTFAVLLVLVAAYFLAQGNMVENNLYIGIGCANLGFACMAASPALSKIKVPFLFSILPKWYSFLLFYGGILLLIVSYMFFDEAGVIPN